MTVEVKLSPATLELVRDMQQLVTGHELADIHAAYVCLYVQMIFMCAKSPRDAKVLANKMCEDIKGAVVNNMPKVKPVVVHPEKETMQ